MRTAALQLKFYFVTELHVTANRDHAPDKPLRLDSDDLLVTPTFRASPDNGRHWEVTLRIQQQGGPSTNAPYYFTVELVGSFDVSPGYPEAQVEWMVRTNASSVLYSTAREVLRNAMSQGPFCALLLPTVSFYTPETKELLEGAATKVGTPKSLSGETASREQSPADETQTP